MKTNRMLLICIATVLAGRAVAVEIVDATVDRRNGIYHVHGVSLIQASPEFVFQSIMDYDNFYKLAGGIAETRFVDSQIDGELMGYTRFESCLLFFCKTVEKLERIVATPNIKITTEALPEQSDFEINKTSWNLAPEGDGTRLTYTAEFEPDFWMPPLLGTWAIKRKLVATARLMGLRIEYLADNGLTLAMIRDPDAD